MKKLIVTPFLFCLPLFSTWTQAQESVDVLIHENGTERQESIELPQSMTYPLDSLFSDWQAKSGDQLAHRQHLVPCVDQLRNAKRHPQPHPRHNGNAIQ